jgi:hypothetical protein
MAGRIAQLLDLPIPPIAQVEIPSGLIRFDPELARDLGAGVAFGSRHVANAMEFAASRITDVPEALRWRLLFFDWWVMNEDRYLGPSGGNVNLLWTEADARLHVIDHNLSFDPSFDEEAMLAGHVFRDVCGGIWRSFAEDERARVQLVMEQVEDCWKEIPAEWTDGAALGYNGVLACLHRVHAAGFFGDSRL